MSITSARNQAEALIDILGITDAPVDVEGIARHLKLQVLYTELEDGISGILITGQNGSSIAIRKDDHEVRKRFSISHEIGHYYLKHQFQPGEHVHVDRGYLISHRNIRSSTGTDFKEIEANQFAACLLMPSKLLRKTIQSLHIDHVYDSHVMKLAQMFKVSEQAMTIRLSTLGFIA